MGTSSLILVHPTPIIAVHMSKSEEEPPPNTDVVLAGSTDFSVDTIARLSSSAPDDCTIRRSVASCVHGNWRCTDQDLTPITSSLCVDSEKISNGKKKGQGNTKNGNTYLAWAFVEAAHFAVRDNTTIKRFYERKKAKTKMVVALTAVAHKLCQACSYMMRNQAAFDMSKAFGTK